MSVDNPTTTTDLKIVCTQENFSQGLQMVNRIATTKSSLPILANIHVIADQGELTLAATDLEVGITTKIGAKVNQQGAITLPARLLVDFITNNTDSTITITTEGTDATLSSDRYQALIKGMDATEFPLIPKPGVDETASIPASVLKKSLADVAFAAAFDDTRPVLNGILLHFVDETLTLAATDSYRLAERKITLLKKRKGELKAILPARSATELIRIIPDAADTPVRISLAASQISLEFGETQIVSRLVEGSYPDYTQIIPKSATTTVTISRVECSNAVKMASLFAKDVAHHIRLHIDPKKSSFEIRAAASSAGTNTSTVPAEIDGEALEVAFNARFLLDALGAVGGEMVTLQFLGADRPVVIRSGDQPDYLNLVMPLRFDS